MGKTVSPLFLSSSWSDPFYICMVMITYMRAWMSLKFKQIQTLVSMVTDRVMMEKKNGVSTFSRLFFILFLFILAGNNDMHESSDEFEFRPHWTIECGVSCPWTSEKNPHRLIMRKPMSPIFSRLFLMGSFLYLQVMITYLRAWMNLK